MQLEIKLKSSLQKIYNYLDIKTHTFRKLLNQRENQKGSDKLFWKQWKQEYFILESMGTDF